MVKRYLTILALFLFLLFSPLVCSPLYAKDYSISSADFVVQINPDGSADVTETRVYSFSGSFTWADEWIPTKGYSISGIDVEGADRFEVTPGKDKVYIKWYYSALSTQKTFILNYKIPICLFGLLPRY